MLLTCSYEPGNTMNNYQVAGLAFSLGVLLTVYAAKQELKEEYKRGYSKGRVSALKDVVSGACINYQIGPNSECRTKFQIIVGNLEEKGTFTAK